MLGADTECTTIDELVAFAIRCFQRQSAMLVGAIRRVDPRGLRTLILSGAGEGLAGDVFAKAYPELSPCTVSLADALGPEVSACAPAYAVAVLASERPA